MKAKRGLRKLVDVWGSMAAAAPVHEVIERFLRAHNLDYELHTGTDPYGREYWRYKVQARDLCCAQAVLPALRELQAWSTTGGLQTVAQTPH
jgi:hypothetical protein